MKTITIEVTDDLQERIDAAIDFFEKAIRQWIAKKNFITPTEGVDYDEEDDPAYDEGEMWGMEAEASMVIPLSEEQANGLWYIHNKLFLEYVQEHALEVDVPIELVLYYIENKVWHWKYSNFKRIVIEENLLKNK